MSYNPSMDAGIPSPASAAPPGIGVSSALGTTSTQFARADHTHASSVQRKRVTTTSGGTFTWTFSPAYDAGVVPVVTYGVENTTSATQPFVVNIMGTPTNTSVTFKVFQAQASTLGGTLTAILGAVVAPFTTATTVSLHCWAAAPTP
jgi:hypothetical protein